MTVRPVSTLPPLGRCRRELTGPYPTVTFAAAGVTLTVATSAGSGAPGPVAVVPLATFESAPNVAFTLSVPEGTSWNWYAVAGRAERVQLRAAPIAVPATGVAHVPCDTETAEPPRECPGRPADVVTRRIAAAVVHLGERERLTELFVTLATFRSVTVPGFVAVLVAVRLAVALFPSLVAVIVPTRRRSPSRARSRSPSQPRAHCSPTWKHARPMRFRPNH